MTTAQARYIEAQVLSADPIKLVHLLYDGAIEATCAARMCLAQGDIRGRSNQVTRAWAILQELSTSLDREQGGPVATSLAEMYAYLQSRLMTANAEQTDEPLAEVERLLTELADTWKSVPANTLPAAELELELAC